MMLALAVVPAVLQGAAMLADEAVCHRRRGLPRWERIGHPLDTLTFAACFAWLAAARPGSSALVIYGGLAAFSTLFVTKDEPVHARLCGGGEQWLHAVLFVLHPVVLAAFGLLWWLGGHPTVIAAQLGMILAFGVYQAVYWNLARTEASTGGAKQERVAAGDLAARGQPPGQLLGEPRVAADTVGQVNNQWYDSLDRQWYEAQDNPVALLRAEAGHRNPWVARTIGEAPQRVLDVGCGAGFLANFLAARGHRVTGIDTSAEALEVARRYDRTRSVDYRSGDACALAFPDASFDAVCAMDLLEHVTEPERVIAEAGRVLRPGGRFFFHTFNRTWQAHLIVIKGVEWFVRNTPKDLHVIELFIPPERVTEMCRRAALEPVVVHGSRPRFGWPLWRMLITGRVGDDFRFRFTRSTKLGYTGHARKLAVAAP
jgi:2-polyprenyl-6-hydroxyphenyl methylase/3-demethylubiquinone-9 3-methyltransferase